jgi:serine/threonine protein kinase
VHVASDAADHSRVFALKRIVCHDKAALADAVAEMELLSCLPPHANIIRFRAGTQRIKGKSSQQGEVTEVLLLTDLYRGGGLHEAMDRLRDQGRSLNQHSLLLLFSQACAAVAHLHGQSPPIAHRNIKLENLLLQGDLSCIGSGQGRLVLCL